MYASPTLVGALIALAMIAVIWVGGDSIRTSLQDADEASSDRSAARTYERLLAALDELQDERGLAELWIATGQAPDQRALAAQIARADAALAEIGSGASVDPGFADQLEEIPQRLDPIRATVAGRGEVAFDLYSDVIDLLVTALGETTATTRGSSGFADRRARDVLVDVSESEATRRGLVVGALARGAAIDDALATRLSLLQVDIDSRITDAARLVDGDARERIGALSSSTSHNRVEALVAAATAGATPAPEPIEWFESASTRIDEVLGVVEELNDDEAARADRASDGARRRAVVQAVAFIGLGVVVGGLGRAAVTATRDRAAALEQHEELVAGLRQWFQPAAFAGVPGLTTDTAYEPAASYAQAGGDWFDIFELRNGSVLVGIGDVAGHGPEAVAQMATLRNMFRGQTMSDPAPLAEQVEHLDEAAVNLGIMATLFYGIWERPCMRFRYTRAGHLPAVLIHPCGQVELLDGGSDTLVGVGQRTRRASTDVTVSPGTILVLFTDGVVESAGSRIDRDVQGLVDRVITPAVARSGDSLVQELASDLVEQRPSRHDDAAALVVRFESCDADALSQ